MRVCAIGTQYLGVPAKKGGAIEFLSFELSKGLAVKGNKVTYYSVKNREKLSEPLPKNLLVERFPARKAPGLLFNLFVLFKALPKKFGLIYFTGCSLFPAAFLLSRIKSVPLVFHEFNHLPWIKGKGFLFDFLAMQSVKKSDAVLVPSEFIRKKMVEKARIPAKKVFLVKNFLDIKEFPARKKKKNPVLLFVGRIQKHKGLHHLLEAMPSLLRENPGLKLRVIGPAGSFSQADSSYAGQLKKIIEEKGLAESVEFLGQIERQELLKEFYGSSVFVFPSEEEAFGLVLIEAMASFTPCVAFNVGGVNEVVVNNETGFLVPKGSSLALAEQVGLLLSDEKKAEEFGVNARNRVKNIFNSSTAVQRLDEILKGVAMK